MSKRYDFVYVCDFCMEKLVHLYVVCVYINVALGIMLSRELLCFNILYGWHTYVYAL